MPNYALIKAGAFVEVRVYEAQPTDIPHKQVAWLPFVESYPTFDPATEKLNAPTVTIEAARVFKTATKRLLTVQELDDIKQAQVDGVMNVLLQVILNHENRLRVFELKPSITMQQLKAALKAML